MKPIVKLITLTVITAALSLAQRTPPDPAAMIQRQVEHLSSRLTLTTAQQAQASTIFTKAQADNQSLTASLHAAHTSLAAAIKSNDAASIATISAQIGTLNGQIMANSSKAEASFYATLTPDQQTKYTPGAGGFGGFAGRGPGGPGGPRPPR